MDSPAHFVKVEKYSQVQWESSSFGVSVCGFWFSCSLHLKLTWLQMYSSCVLCDCHLLDENFFAPLALQCGHVLPKFLPAHNTCLHRGPNQVMKTTKHQARPAIWSSFAVLLWHSLCIFNEKIREMQYKVRHSAGNHWPSTADPPIKEAKYKAACDKKMIQNRSPVWKRS